MKVECPKCRFTAQVDESKIPEKGVVTTCRKCQTKFRLTRSGAAPIRPAKGGGETPVASKPKPKPDSSPTGDSGPAGDGKVACPKCKHRQYPAAACVYCGTPFPESLQSGGGRPEPAAPTPPAGAPRPTPPPVVSPPVGDAGEESELATKRCPHCDERIRKRAKVCKHCGESLADLTEPDIQPLGVGDIIPSFLDFGFNRFVVPELLKLVYLLTVILGGLVALGMLGYALYKGQFFSAIGVIFTYVGAVLTARIYAETMMILFRVEENTRRRKR